MGVANARMSNLSPPRHLSLAFSPTDSVVNTFHSVWETRPSTQRIDSPQLEELRKFVITSWIDDQIHYNGRISARNHGLHHIMTYSGNVLFGLTFVAAASHALHFGTHGLQLCFTFMAISFPAIGGALGAI